jgi:hypothetical protein
LPFGLTQSNTRLNGDGKNDMMTATFERGGGSRFARAAVFGLLALTATLLGTSTAQGQWTTPNTQGNINSTNTGNVGIGTTTPAYQLDLLSPTDKPFRVRDTAGREYFSTSSRTGAYPTWTTPVVSLAGGRLIVENNGPEGDNHSIVRRAVNSLIFNPSDHPELPGGLLVRQVGGNPILFVNQSTNGNIGIGTSAPAYLLDISGSTSTPFRVRDIAGREYFSTSTRTGPWGTTPIVSLAGGRLMVEHNGPDGDNQTVVRRAVNGLIINPSEHSQLPGAFMVRQVGGYYGLFVDQNTNGNVGVGTTAPADKLHVAGNIRVDGNINAKYQDVAEWVPSKQRLAAGTVVVLDKSATNHVHASSRAYDTKVAGVISLQPGISLGEAGEGKVLVATTGRVKIKVDASRGPIEVGDLLVTSDVAGVAMKSVPVELGGTEIHRPGTIIGKALEPLEKGTGEILVLLSLQ